MTTKMKRPVGRPRLNLDKDKLFDLAKIHCTMIEIASIMGCSVDTLENNYSDIIKKGKEEGKSSLRRIQYKAAVKGSVTMMIWLGKQLLGQRDKTEQEINVNIDDRREIQREVEQLLREVAGQ